MRQGLLGTFDETTRKFFEGTKVMCKLAFRGSDQQKNIIKSNIGCARCPPPLSCCSCPPQFEGVFLFRCINCSDWQRLQRSSK